MNGINTANEEITRSLEESLNICKQSSRLMQRNLQTGRLMDAFRNCSISLVEMRNSALTPKQYYELYMFNMESLRLLGGTLLETHLNGTHNLMDLYELVQYAGSIVPRLYLMITVGSAYLETPNALVREIMNDLLDMCRGVQHPLRGLFLRHYLLTQTRKGLPLGSEDEEDASRKGTVLDSVKFLVINFTEMNKLWVRIQHLGPIKEFSKRTQERNELKVLVGLNLVRLSQLNLDIDTYRDHVLPAIIEQIIECRDSLAQEYLVEVICQAFSDNMHLQTLDTYFGTVIKLSPSVNVTQLVVAMLNRLTDYVQREYESDSSNEDESETVTEKLGDIKINEEVQQKDEQECPGDKVIPPEYAIQEVLWSHVVEVIQSRSGLPLDCIVSILSSILNFFLRCYPYKPQYADRVFQYINEHIINQPSLRSALHERPLQKSLCAILLLPLTYFPSFSYCLELQNFLPVFNAQDPNLRYDIARMIVQKIIEKGHSLSELTEAQELLGFVSVIIEKKGVDSLDDLQNVALMVHYLNNDDPQIQIEVLYFFSY